MSDRASAATLTLRQTQSLFAKLLGQLIVWIYEQGWEVTLADGFRPDAQGHMKGSLHYQRLAQDLNLFVAGRYMDTDCPEWQAVGAQWKSYDELCRWGGDFASKDLNHMSITWEGRA